MRIACKPLSPKRLRYAVLLLLLPCLLGWRSNDSTEPRRDARVFILETLRQQAGSAWDRVGQFLLWSYDFDAQGCELTVQRESGFGDSFTQTIPFAEAAPVGVQRDQLLLACRARAPCIHYAVSNPRHREERRVPRSGLLVMNPDDLTPLSNAFAELHRLCRDPYSPANPRR